MPRWTDYVNSTELEFGTPRSVFTGSGWSTEYGYHSVSYGSLGFYLYQSNPYDSSSTWHPELGYYSYADRVLNALYGPGHEDYPAGAKPWGITFSEAFPDNVDGGVYVRGSSSGDNLSLFFGPGGSQTFSELCPNVGGYPTLTISDHSSMYTFHYVYVYVISPMSAFTNCIKDVWVYHNGLTIDPMPAQCFEISGSM